MGLLLIRPFVRLVIQQTGQAPLGASVWSVPHCYHSARNGDGNGRDLCIESVVKLRQIA